MESRSELVRRLRDHGLRVTLPRLAVLEYLASSTSHPTAEEVGAAVNRLVPTASRASVYNVLHSLTEVGLVEELVFDDAVARFDANLSRHQHFVCTRCRKVEDVAWQEALPAGGRLPGGQLVEDVIVTFRGICGRCAEALPQAPAGAVPRPSIGT
jgi:Fur family transcriptional regulator, peroxide stress response regulator